MRYIIGFSGPKRSGKDFGASVLIEALTNEGYTVYRDSFARNLRALASLVTGQAPFVFDERKDERRTFILSQDATLSALRSQGYLRAPENATATEVGLQQYEWMRAIDYQLKIQMRQSPMTFANDGADPMTLLCTGRDILIILGQAARQIDPEFWVRALAIDLSELPENAVVVLTDVRPENEARCCDFVVEVTSPTAQYVGSATESPLPPHLVHASLRNNGDATYGHSLRGLSKTLSRLIAGKRRDTEEQINLRSHMSPQMYNRAFLETL